MKLEDTLENEIRCRKRVGVADRSKADILGRPMTETFRFKQSFPKRHGVLSFRKRNCSAQHAAAKIANGLFSSHRCRDLTEITLYQDFRSRKQPHSLSGYRMSDQLSVGTHELRDESGSLFSRNQLA
jgi:hypothetical protein